MKSFLLWYWSYCGTGTETSIFHIVLCSDEAQIQLVEAQEKERVSTEHALELNSRVTAVESQLATYRQDKSRLEATLEMERAKLEAAEEATSR